jgi:hypothetical protein
VLALETLHGHRIVASPKAIDALDGTVEQSVRVAPDELFVLGAGPPPDVDDEHAIVVPESGFVGCWLDSDELASVVRHLEWPLPANRPSVAQGFVAGVPAKLWLTSNRALLVCAAAYAHELTERLS